MTDCFTVPLWITGIVCFAVAIITAKLAKYHLNDFRGSVLLAVVFGVIAVISAGFFVIICIVYAAVMVPWPCVQVIP